MTGLRRITAPVVCAAVANLPTLVIADPWKDESGHGRGRGEYKYEEKYGRHGEAKREWKSDDCKDEYKADRGGVKEEYKCVSIDRRFGFIRASAVTSASAADGRELRHLVSLENTGSEVWADSAYRSQSNERWLAGRMLTSRIHRRKPAGRPMPRNVARANAKKSAIRAAVEHVFAHQKTRFGLFIRTIGIRTIGLARDEAKLTLANISYNFDRLIFHERRRAMG